MRPMDANTLNALTGSRVGDSIIVYAWYDGELSFENPLNVTSWSISWDRSRQISQLDLTVTDESGDQAPWLLEDPLGVGGAELQVIYQVGGAGAVNLGWYRITDSDPDDSWRSYIINERGFLNPNSPLPKDKRLIQISGGTQIGITALDRGQNAALSRLIAPESPAGVSPTIVSEIGRLVGDITQVVTADGVVDRAVNKTLIYEDDRLNAIQDLAKRISCDVRMTGDGQMEIYPVTPQTPVWTIQGGPEGALVKVNRSMQLDGLYNIFVVTGTATNAAGQQIPIQSVSMITTGPLAVDGPHGRYPTFYTSNMIATQAEADAYAQTMMTTQIAGLTVDLKIECLPHPGIQQGDWVTVIAPTSTNQDVGLVGSVKTMSLNSSGTTVDRMSLTVECSYAAVQKVIGGLARD